MECECCGSSDAMSMLAVMDPEDPDAIDLVEVGPWLCFECALARSPSPPIEAVLSPPPPRVMKRKRRARAAASKRARRARRRARRLNR